MSGSGPTNSMSAVGKVTAGDRAVLVYDHDEEGALDGAQLISAETDPGLQREQDIFIFINENFAAFLGYLHNLNLRDQELLLVYYCLRKTQTLLAPIFQTSHTLCSARMRAAVRVMCAYIAFGGQPTEERMRPILQAVGAEEASLSTRPKMQYKEHGENLSQRGKDGKAGKAGEKATHSLARLLAECAGERSFRMLADRHGIHQPEIRRAFRRAAERLEVGGREQQALAAWIRSLIDKANPFGEGESKRQAAKRGDVFASDDARIADFRIRIEDGLLARILAPRGNL
jgi:hypothetical protein